MAGDINIGAATKPTTNADIYAQAAKATGTDAAKIKEITSKAMEILAGSNVKVTRSDSTGVDGAAEKKTTGATNVPALDNPADEKQVEANLEKLMAYLMMDNEERQTEMAKERINIQKSNLESEHKNRMEKLEETLKKMDDAYKASKASRVLSWLGAILAVVTAVVISVVSFGTAACFAIAGAAIAVGSLIMNETGATDKLIEKIADMFEKSGDGANSAKLKAALIVNLTIMALQLGCSIGSLASAACSAASAASGTAKAVSDTIKTVQGALNIANTATGVVSMGVSGANTYFSYRSDNSKADTTELEKYINQLQQRIEESEEELQRILELLQAAVGDIAAIIASATDTSAAIASNIGQMA